MSRSRRFSVRKSVVRSTSRSARLRRDFHLGMDWLESRTLLSAVASVPTFIVNSNGDQPLANSVAGGNAETALGTVTLRSAIEQANLDGSGTINFSGPMTIDVGSQLDPITASNVSIVGTGLNSVVVSGSSANEFISGLIIAGTGGDSIQNLVLTGFLEDGIEIESNGNSVINNVINGNQAYGVEINNGSYNQISGNKIGTDSTGSISNPNYTGIIIDGSSTFNTIGGTSSGSSNLISGNSAGGIYVYGQGSQDTLIQGNFIGTDSTGTKALPNGAQGIAVYGGASSATIGGTTTQARNLISGNLYSGINIDGSSTSGVAIEGNYIGVNISGNAALGNGHLGIDIYDGATSVTVGGTVAGSGNIISGNAYEGIAVSDAGTSNNLVEGNFIGTDYSGEVAIPNLAGIGLYNGANQNTIGGTVAGSGNVISGNTDTGVVIYGSGTSQNLVQANMIGVDVSGTKALGNGYDGVDIESGASNNTLGGSVQGSMNVISGNLNDGVEIRNSGTDTNLVLGNMIGVNVTGTSSIPNSLNGVDIHGAASSNTIGGTSAASQNVISGNVNFGVSIYGLGTTKNVLMGNLIGVGEGGSTAIPNSLSGLSISQGATFNTIGGTTTGAGNVISGNTQSGVVITNKGTMRNLVQGNLIGTDSSGSIAVANGTDGIDITTGALLNTIGGTALAADNVIAGNKGNGIAMIGYGTTGNLVLGNSIGVTLASQALGNGGDGVLFTSGASHNTIGGSTSGYGNAISYSGKYGVQVGLNATDGTYSDSILGNSIYGNTLLGISLGGFSGDGPNPTDGPNRGLNYPELVSAVETNNNLTINGFYGSFPSSTFRIEIFATDPALIEAFGASQGEFLLGYTTITLNSFGTAEQFEVNFPIIPGTGSYVGYTITTTATDKYGDTSQFSNAVVVTAG